MSHRTYFKIVPGPNGINQIQFISPTFDHTNDPPPPEPPPYVPERLALLEEINRDGGIDRIRARMKHAGERRKLPETRLIGACDVLQTVSLRRKQARRMREYLDMSPREVAAAMHVSRSGIYAAETASSRSALLLEMIAFLKEQIKQKALRWSERHGHA